MAALRADIVGTYLVEGVRPETGEPYRGSVTIERIGEKYAVTWDIEGSERVGVGLGGAFSGGNFMVGPAHPDDLMITIGFRDGDVTGIATMFWQDTREYEGFYVEPDKDIAGFEIWSIDD